MAKHFEVKIGDGTVVARSMTLGSTDLAAAQPGSKPVKYDCPLPRDESGRAVLISLELSQKGPPE